MRWISLLLLPGALTLLPACTGGTGRALEKGGQLQRSGQPAEALQCLLEARVEAPESTELVFSIAGAEAALGDHLLAQHDLEGARSRLAAARETYGRCAVEPKLAGGVAYNVATCLLHLDGVLERQADYAGRVENLRAAVTALDAVVVAYPEQARAKKNLDCARYRLALLLQSAPSASEKKDGAKPEEESKPLTGVAGATTQIPGATVEVEAGSVVVLRTQPSGEVTP